jgi:hypothetical protein
MKIAIIGSMKFAEEMIRTQKELQEMGHDALVPLGTEPHINDKDFVENLEDNLAFCIKEDIMRRNFQQVANSDAVLVLNYKRNGIDGYIGVSALMEMGVAHFLNKKIFLMQPMPDFNEARWAHEVAIMQPTIISNDLSKIA